MKTIPMWLQFSNFCSVKCFKCLFGVCRLLVSRSVRAEVLAVVSGPLWGFYQLRRHTRQQSSPRPLKFPPSWRYRPARQLWTVAYTGWTKGRINPTKLLCVKYPSKALSPKLCSLHELWGFIILHTNTFILLWSWPPNIWVSDSQEKQRCRTNEKKLPSDIKKKENVSKHSLILN